MTSVTVAFEYHIRYITDHRILDRNRLKGSTPFYLGDGTEVQGALANRYADRRNSTKPAFQYRAIVFNPHRRKLLPPHLQTVNGTAGHAIESSIRGGLVTTPSGSTVTAPVLLCYAAGHDLRPTPEIGNLRRYIGETGQDRSGNDRPYQPGNCHADLAQNLLDHLFLRCGTGDEILPEPPMHPPAPRLHRRAV